MAVIHMAEGHYTSAPKLDVPAILTAALSNPGETVWASSKADDLCWSAVANRIGSDVQVRLTYSGLLTNRETWPTIIKLHCDDRVARVTNYERDFEKRQTIIDAIICRSAVAEAA